MSLILAWVLFPLLLAAIGVGWGVLVERAAGTTVNDALLLPLGLAAALVVAGTLTTFASTAPAANSVVAVGTAAGLILLIWPRLPGRAGAAAGLEAASPGRPAARRRMLPGRWPLLAAVGALLVYGAPVLLSGQATFTGYLKLDDTATWFNIVDIVMSHSHSLTAMNAAFHPPSDFTTVFVGDVGEHYPLGAFMLLGVGHGLTGIDPAWIIQPYFACCAAALALCVYALVGALVPSPRLRALVAFLAAQPALLYGYSLWGGIKEKMIMMGPFNPIVPRAIQDKVNQTAADIGAGKFHPFTGPVVDNQGKERLAAGKVMSDEVLSRMDYYVEGVQGTLPASK